jgi:hypothetical protein
MPWKETSPMNERVKFVAAMLAAEETFGERAANASESGGNKATSGKNGTRLVACGH